MPIEITVPRLGWSMDEGTLTEWLKTNGSFVRKGEMLFVLEGDKSAQEIESFDEGYLYQLPDGPQPGDSVQVGQLLGYLLAEGESPPGQADRETTASVSSSVTEVPVPAVSSPIATPAVLESPAEPPEPVSSPRARRRAHELGVAWRELTGSGRHGRIRERDVLAAANRPAHEATVRTTATSSMRKTIAERMLTSHQSTAPVTLTTSADVTHLVALRRQFQVAAANGGGLVPSYSDFIVKLTAMTLRSYPALNARWDGDAITQFTEVHLGLAVDTDAGLLVPVVRNAERLSLRSIAARTKELIELARARRLPVDAMQGGTFTVTNLGGLGIDAFTPLIHVPQCAILGVGRIRREPVYVENQLLPREVLTLSLTFDHRVVDGAPAARFLQALCQSLENPAERLIE